MNNSYDLLVPYLDKVFPGDKVKEPLAIVFLDFLKRTGGYSLELSQKMKNGQMMQSRLAAGYTTEVNYHFNECLNFIDGVPGVSTAAARSFMNGISITSAPLMVFGIDLDDNVNSSRLKMYVHIPGNVELNAKIMRSMPYTMELLAYSSACVAFDFFLDGATHVKTYLAFANPVLAQGVLSKFFEPWIVKAMTFSSSVGVAYKTSGTEKFVYFLGSHLDKVIQQLALKNVQYDSLRFCGFDPYIFGMFHSDMVRHEAATFNVYYPLFMKGI